jgi:hypothetical protein
MSFVAIEKFAPGFFLYKSSSLWYTMQFASYELELRNVDFPVPLSFLTIE